jgi:triphosphatase
VTQVRSDDWRSQLGIIGSPGHSAACPKHRACASCEVRVIYDKFVTFFVVNNIVASNDHAHCQGGRTCHPRGHELELKLELTHHELRRLDASQALAPVTVGPPTRQTLRSIYFDTQDQRLRGAGLSLRVRSDGASWVQTVKCGTGVVNGVSHPIELETAVSGPEPDLAAIDHCKLGRKIRQLTQGSRLEPAFQVEVVRTTHKLHTKNGELELALDEGCVRTGELEAPLCEAELELKSGDPTCLLDMAAKLFADTPLCFSGGSKAERGYDLLGGRVSARKLGCGPPVHAQPVELAGHATCGDALLAIMRSAEHQIQANRLVVLGSDDPEGPHQLRIGLRRLRTALRAFRPVIDLPSARKLNEHARSLATIIGELRDADVLIDTIFEPVGGLLEDHAGLPPMNEALRTHQLAKRDAMRSALQSKHWSTLQLHLALLPLIIKNHPPLQKPVSKYANKALRRGWSNVAKRGARLGDLTEEQRHEMRKALKQFRYTVEFFHSLYRPADLRPFTKRLKELQDTFGYLNDVAQARQLESVADRYCPDSIACQRLAAYTLGWHAARAVASWESVQESWHHLAEKRQFWR